MATSALARTAAQSSSALASTRRLKAGRNYSHEPRYRRSTRGSRYTRTTKCCLTEQDLSSTRRVAVIMEAGTLSTRSPRSRRRRRDERRCDCGRVGRGPRLALRRRHHERARVILRFIIKNSYGSLWPLFAGESPCALRVRGPNGRDGALESAVAVVAVVVGVGVFGDALLVADERG